MKSTCSVASLLVILVIIMVYSSACGQLIRPAHQSVTPTVVDTPTPEPPITAAPTVTPRPTATLKPATPSATPTPTITPTPIIYTIRPGDTLLSIAIDFETPVKAIQLANGITDPRRLQIGQVLIIPNPENDLDVPTATPTPLPVTVGGLSFQQTPQGSLWAFGEVTNPGPQTLSEIVIEASLYNAEGKLLSSQVAFTQLDLLLPDDRVPFALLFPDPPSTFAQYQVTAISAVPIFGQHRYYTNLASLNTTGRYIDASRYRITGELENTGGSSVEAIKLVATAYNEANQVIAQRQIPLSVILLRPKARTPFSIDLTIADGSTIAGGASIADTIVDHYAIQAQGLRSP